MNIKNLQFTDSLLHFTANPKYVKIGEAILEAKDICIYFSTEVTLEYNGYYFDIEATTNFELVLNKYKEWLLTKQNNTTSYNHSYREEKFICGECGGRVMVTLKDNIFYDSKPCTMCGHQYQRNEIVNPDKLRLNE